MISLTAIDDSPAVEDHDETVAVSSTREQERIETADTIVPARDTTRSPGQVVRTGTIELHTKSGHQMFHGRLGRPEKPAIVGLVRFIANMNKISNFSLDGDPYADAKLLRIEQLMSECAEQYEHTLIFLESLLRNPSRRRPVIISHGSKKPQTFDLSIASGYGWRGADLLADYDQIMQYGLDAQHVRRLDQQGWTKHVADAGRKLRRLYLESTRYSWSGVTRKDLSDMTDQAQDVIEQRGPLSVDILSGQMLPKLRPEFKVRQS